MKKGKVEWLYKVSTLMAEGTIGYDWITTTSKLGKKEVQELAEAMKTDVHVVYVGTIIMAPDNDKRVMTYQYLTEEERQIRLEFAKKQYEKEAAAVADTNENAVQ